MQGECKTCGRIKELIHCNDCYSKILNDVVQRIFETPPIQNLEMEIQTLQDKIDDLRNELKDFKLGIKRTKKPQKQNGYVKTF